MNYSKMLASAISVLILSLGLMLSGCAEKTKEEKAADAIEEAAKDLEKEAEKLKEAAEKEAAKY